MPTPRERALALLERVGLPHLADERVGRLSRGQQQRVTIARALLHDPPVLLLDEPDTGLDLAAFALRRGPDHANQRTVVLTTHNLASGLRLGTRVGVLARGRLVHQQAAVSAARRAGPGRAAGAPGGRREALLGQLRTLIWKDLLVEARGRETVLAGPCSRCWSW